MNKRDFIGAINKGDLQTVKLLINDGVAVNPPKNNDKSFGLFDSCMNENNRDTIIIDSECRNGREFIPLNAAIEAKQSDNKFEIVKALVEFGANVDLEIIENSDYVGSRSSYSETLLQTVIIDTLRDPERNIEILNLFFKKGANPNKLKERGHGTKRGCTSFKSAIIHSIAENKEVKMLKALLEGGAYPDIIRSESIFARPNFEQESEKTSLHIVCEKRKLENYTEENELIEKEKQFEMAKLLIQYGADVNKVCPRVESNLIANESKKNDEKTYYNKKVLEYPIHLAIFSENLKLVRLLMDNGAKEFERIYGDKTSTCLEIVDELIKKAESEKRKKNLENIIYVIQNKGKYYEEIK